MLDPNEPLTGALDNYDIYLFVSYSIEDSKLNQYWNFQLKKSHEY